MSGLDDHYLNITASNMDRYQKQQDESCDDVYGRLLSRSEDHREWLREKCMSGDVFTRSEAMTLTALRDAVEALVPNDCTFEVSLNARRDAPATYIKAEAGRLRVNAEISVWYRGQYYGVDAPTYEEALAKFRANTLEAMGLTTPAPAAERLAAMDVEQ